MARCKDALLRTTHACYRMCRTEGGTLSYAVFLDRMDTIEQAQARIDAMRDANAPHASQEAPPPLLQALEDAAADSGAVCFHGMHELHTSTGNIVWLLAETEDALEAQYPLAMPPWRLGADLPPATVALAGTKTHTGMHPLTTRALQLASLRSMPGLFGSDFVISDTRV